MRAECLNHRFVYEAPYSVVRLSGNIADKAQVNTQRSHLRPYGVGILMAGHDATGPRLFYNCPSGNSYEYYATAVGARSQACKTYLEKQADTLLTADKDNLARHVLLLCVRRAPRAA